MTDITPLFTSIPEAPDNKPKKQKQVYTILTYMDIVKLLIDYKIPIAYETVKKLQQNSIYYVEGELETVIK